MSTECKTMRELHAIRERIHEETKDMTPEEEADFIHARVEKQLMELGITLKRPEPETALRR